MRQGQAKEMNIASTLSGESFGAERPFSLFLTKEFFNICDVVTKKKMLKSFRQ